MSTSNAASWPRQRLKYALRSDLAEWQRSVLTTASVVPFVPMEAIGERGELDLSRFRPLDEVANGFTRFFEGDVVVAKITPCFENGKGALIRGTKGVGFGTTELHVLSPIDGVDGKFLYYITAGIDFRRSGTAMMSGAAGQKRVPEEFVQNYRISVPPLPLQRTIAAFLDRETAKIDAMIVAKERLLGLLAEKRRALITHAVTRGLNPNAPMRDSGIEWLGEIPEHWDVVPLRYLVDITSGSTPDKGNAEYWGGNIPWVSPKDMKQDRIADAEDHVTDLAMQETTLALIPAGSVLVVIRGMILAHSFPTAVTTAQVTINQDMKALRCRPLIEPEFLWAYFRGIEKYIVSQTDQSSHGTKKIDTDILGAVPIPLPSQKEQRAIIDAVVERSGVVDRLMSQLRHSISLLRERRSSLITAAVTGQVDVEDAA